MNRFFKLSGVVALAVLGSVWSQGVQAQQAHDAVAKARGVLGANAVVTQPEGRFVAGRPAVQRPVDLAQRSTSGLVRTFSYDPNQAAARQVVPQNVPAQPQHLGFHDAGAKVRGVFGN